MMRIPNPGLPAPQIADPRGNFWAELPGVTDKYGLHQGQPAADMANPRIALPPPPTPDRMEIDPRAALAQLLARGV